MYHYLKLVQSLWRRIFRTDVDLDLLKVCAKFLEKVTRNTGVKDEKIQPNFKYTFMDGLP